MLHISEAAKESRCQYPGPVGGSSGGGLRSIMQSQSVQTMAGIPWSVAMPSVGDIATFLTDRLMNRVSLPTRVVSSTGDEPMRDAVKRGISECLGELGLTQYGPGTPPERRARTAEILGISAGVPRTPADTIVFYHDFGLQITGDSVAC